MNEIDLRARQEAAMNKLERIAAEDSARSTIVEMTDDYSQDTRYCLTCVAFVPETVRARIMEEVIRPLETQFPQHHFYAPGSLHLTVQNVRKVDATPSFSEATIAMVGEAFARVFVNVSPLNFSLDGLLKLPTSVAIRAYADQRFQNLVQTLRTTLIDLNLPDDKFYVDPDLVFGNITFCRYRSAPDEALLRALDSIQFAGEMEASEISLITTNAACHPAHTKVWRRFSLG